MSGTTPINKTMDRQDLEFPAAQVVVGELNELITELRSRELAVSSWYGFFDYPADLKRYEEINRGYGYRPLPNAVEDENFPWFLYWEIAWVMLNNDYQSGQRLLDMGGSSSLFSYYLASKGMEVTTIDLRPDLVQNADHVGREMGWKLDNELMDMRDMKFENRFDHITSICVYEHIPMSDRIEINRSVRELLNPGGTFTITFDYRNPSRLARILTPADVEEQFVRTSGLEVRGNGTFVEGPENYLLNPFYAKPRWWRGKARDIRDGYFPLWELPRAKGSNDYTFGALFQKRSSRESD